MTTERPMTDTPCACGCGQDAATIERLERSRAVAVRQLGEALDRAERAEAAIERARVALDSVGVLHPVAADRVLRALDGPQAPVQAPDAPGQGEGAGNAGGGHVEALARALFEWNTPTDPYFVIRGRTSEMGDGRDPYLPIVEAILADPGLLLAALAEAGVLDLHMRVMWNDEEGDTYDEIRYTTEWRPADARP